MAIIQYKGFNQTVETITDRNNITRLVDGMVITVKDAIADPQAGSGVATYRYLAETATWILISKSSHDSINFITEELTIENGEVTLSQYPTDNQLWNIVALSSGIIMSDLKIEDLTIVGNTVTGVDFNNYESIRVTYAYGEISPALDSYIDSKLAEVGDSQTGSEAITSFKNKYGRYWFAADSSFVQRVTVDSTSLETVTGPTYIPSLTIIDAAKIDDNYIEAKVNNTDLPAFQSYYDKLINLGCESFEMEDNNNTNSTYIFQDNGESYFYANVKIKDDDTGIEHTVNSPVDNGDGTSYITLGKFIGGVSEDNERTQTTSFNAWVNDSHRPTEHLNVTFNETLEPLLQQRSNYNDGGLLTYEFSDGTKYTEFYRPYYEDDDYTDTDSSTSNSIKFGESWVGKLYNSDLGEYVTALSYSVANKDSGNGLGGIRFLYEEYDENASAYVSKQTSISIKNGTLQFDASELYNVPKENSTVVKVAHENLETSKVNILYSAGTHYFLPYNPEEYSSLEIVISEFSSQEFANRPVTIDGNGGYIQTTVGTDNQLILDGITSGFRMMLIYKAGLWEII